MNIQSLRAETPGCKTKIHFNNAGSSLPPSAVLNAMTEYLTLEAQMGGYETADLKAAEGNGFYKSMAALLNCSAENIAFTSSATSSFSRALSCIPFKAGDYILIANEDYISNQLVFLSLQKRFGIRLLRANSLPEGGTDIDDMKRLMDQFHPTLVSISHTQTNSGLIQPAEEIGKLCRERSITYLVDACQSVGQLPVDVKKIQCDFLTGTFRKFVRGPRGAGFLFVSDRVLKTSMEPLFIDMRGADWKEKDSYTLRADARRFEEWELPYALVAGSKTAVDYSLSIGLEEIQKRNKYLCDIVRKQITDTGLTLLDKGKHLSSIITVKIPGKESHDVLQSLRNKNINTSITYRGSAVIDFDAKGVIWALRISPHYYNTEEEIGLLVQALKELSA
ncbi:MAG: aminotransferase class V-fold PLP-dependent enzyme [Bacteroidota bacterium]